jgi:myosin heavy subunit
MSKVKLVRLELENVKRVSIVKFDISENGLTLIGGANQQGKTTILDSIAFALGGKKYAPSNLQREGSMATAHIKVTMSNGLVVERKGKTAALKITDPSGKKAGQALLDSFIDELSINLPKFIQMNDIDKAKQLLRILGIEKELLAIDAREDVATDARKEAKIIAGNKEAAIAEMPIHDDVPAVPVDTVKLIKKSGEILKRNEANQKLRNSLSYCEQDMESAKKSFELAQEELKKAKEDMEQCKKDLDTARKSAENLQDESTEELQTQIENVEDTNAKVRDNLNKEKAEEELEVYTQKVDEAETEVTSIRAEREKFLNNAKMPLPNLTVGKNKKDVPCLLYDGKEWDCMSTMEQIRVATAIVKELKPECGFILLDGLEAFDNNNLKELGEWLTKEELQAIGTRVGTDGECSLIIEDGQIKEGSLKKVTPAKKKAVKEVEPKNEVKPEEENPWA